MGNDKSKTKKIYVSTYAVKRASKELSSKDGSTRSASGRFVSRDEIKAAFKTAARKLKSA